MQRRVGTEGVTNTGLLNSRVTMMTVNPDDLRFSQDSIACHFQAPHEHISVRDALEKIQTGQMCADDFPRVRVISYEGSLWSTDNRWLWVFRKAKCLQITVKIMTTMHPRLDDLISAPSRYDRLSKPEFLSRVRGKQNVSPVPTVSSKVLDRSLADVMSRYGFLEKAKSSQNVPKVNSTNLHRRVLDAVIRERPTLRPVLPSPNSLVVTVEGSIDVAGVGPESSNAKAHMKPFLSSFSGE